MLPMSPRSISDPPARASQGAPADAAADPTAVPAALADRPLLVLAVVAVWCATGLVIASVVARRGHERRPMGALGIAFGPLLAGFAASSLRSREEHASAVVLRPPRQLGGTDRVLVAVQGNAADAADALPLLRTSGDDLGEVSIGCPVSFEDAELEGRPESDAAAAFLRQAAVFLDEFEPGLVLLPGRFEDAVCRHLASGDVDVVILAGDHQARVALCRDRDLRTVTMVRGVTG